jgi:hypothetical protein
MNHCTCLRTQTSFGAAKTAVGIPLADDWRKQDHLSAGSCCFRADLETADQREHGGQTSRLVLDELPRVRNLGQVRQMASGVRDDRVSKGAN